MLDDCGTPYMLTGSLAAAYHASPRATKDIDIVLESDEARLHRLTTHLRDSELQRRDVVELLERAWERLDLAYIERWVVVLGLEAEWEAARARASPSRGE